MKPARLVARVLARLSSSERMLLGAGIVLTASLFLKWFGQSFAVGDLPLGALSESAWEGLPVIRWLLLATSLLSVAAAFSSVVAMSQRMRAATATLVTLAGGASYLLILWRLIDPPGELDERALAAFVGLVSTAVIAYAGQRLMEASGITFRSAADTLALRRSDRSGARPRRQASTPPPPPKRDRR